MGIEGHAVQGRHVLALGAGGDDDHLVLGQALGGGDVHDGAGLDLQIAQLRADLEHILHASAGDGHLSAVALGRLDDGLDAVHVGGEGGDDDALVAVAELLVQVPGDGVLAGGDAGALDVGGVGKQRQNALLAQLAEPCQIGHAVGGAGVDLEVAGEDDLAHGGGDAEGHGVGDGVVDVDEFHGEAAGFDGVAGLVGDELDLLVQAVLLQLQLDQAVGHGGAVDGAHHLLHGVGDGADVVLVSVGDEETLELVLVLHKVGKVGDDQVHAVHILIGEGHAAVDDDHILAILQDGAVLADLIQTAQRNDFQFFSQFVCKLLSKGGAK